MKVKLPITVLETMQKFVDVGAEIYVVGGAVRDILSNKPVGDWDFTTNLTPEEILKLFPENSFYDNQFGTVGVKIPISHVIPAKAGISSREIKIPDQQLKNNMVVRNDKNGEDKDIRKNPLEISENPSPQYEIYEITTFRTESNYTDRRRPEKVEWGKTLDEDLQRRDFTINSMAIKILPPFVIPAKAGILNQKIKIPDQQLKNNMVVRNDNYTIRKNPLGIRGNPSTQSQDDQVQVEVELIDIFNGQEDLKNKLIRCVGEADARFREDALRMMRAIRISTELGFQIEPHTFDAIKNNHQLLKEIAQERITEEFRKIMASSYPVEGVKFLQTTGILEMLIPELLAGYGMKQKGHHIYDVYEHALKALQFCENENWVVRFAALIHDIAKPVVARGEGEARTFYNHEIVGTNIAWEIAKRFKLSREETKKLTTLVRWHMFSVSEFLTDAAVRRFIRRVGTDNIADMMDVRIADRLGSGCTQKEGWRLREFKTRVIEVQQHIPSVTDLKVDGHDVMQVLGIKPGPKIGKILNELFEEIMEDPTKNEREYLMDRIEKLNISW